MAYFPDLAPYWYFRRRSRTFHIGWLDGDHEFATGDTSSEFRARLVEFCQRPVNSPKGLHTCLICGQVDGGGEILVRLGLKIFAAPVLVSHYVNDHGYRPPDEFINAVMKTPIPTSAPSHEFPRNPAPSSKRMKELREQDREIDRLIEAEERAAESDRGTRKQSTNEDAV